MADTNGLNRCPLSPNAQDGWQYNTSKFYSGCIWFESNGYQL